MSNRPRLEVFVAPGCGRCGRSVALIEALQAELGAQAFDWRRVDVVAELDHAVATGVRATPAIAIDGELVFTATPTRRHLLDALGLSNHK